MKTAQAISVEEYLATSYEHDAELIDGQLKKKPMLTAIHSFVQAMIVHWFALHMEEWGILPLPEVRTRVSAANFRLPDVAVIRRAPIRGRTQDEPPLLAIEILSPDDRFSDLRNRASDLSRMGVEHLWLIDPERRESFQWGGAGEKTWLPVDRLEIAGTPLHLDLDWIWGKIPV